MAERKIERSKKPDYVRRKVFHMMVESFENITRHSDDIDDDSTKHIGNGLLMVGEKPEYYYIITGNRIKNEKISKLNAYLDKLNGMSREELDELHKVQMVEGTLSEKGGAGLGLIDIARKTEDKLVFKFVRLDNDYHFFLLKIIVRIN